MIVGMNHFTVIAEDEKKTLDFYVGLLGLTRRPSARPRLSTAPGSTARRRRRCCTSTSTGQLPDAARRRDRPHGLHGAATCKAVKARFDASGVKYDLRQQPGAGTWQLFSYDPNGAKVELDFDPAESL